MHRILLLVLLLPSVLSAEDKPISVLKQLSLTRKEISAIVRGDVVGKTLPVADKRELAVLGATIVDVPPETILDAIRDIQNLKKRRRFCRLQADRLHRNSSPDAGEDDVCAQNEGIAALNRRRIENSRKNKKIEARRAFRELLLTYKGFSGRGAEAAIEYNNKTHHLSFKEFDSILTASPISKLFVLNLFFERVRHRYRNRSRSYIGPRKNLDSSR